MVGGLLLMSLKYVRGRSEPEGFKLEVYCNSCLGMYLHILDIWVFPTFLTNDVFSLAF
jgi:hypothetical protein